MTFIIPKGKFLGGGLSGMVWLLHNGHVAKSPWPGERAEESQADLRLEAQVHARLQTHLAAADYTRRFLQLFSCDPSDATLTMEYMEKGTLRDHLRAHTQTDRFRRHWWILAMAEGLEMLHTNGIIHCDFTPGNMLLDRSLGLKIADFGCSSIDGSVSTGAAGVRFRPCQDWRASANMDDDLFALGSSMYEILTGKSPFADVSSDQVRRLHELRQFADLTGLDMADIIRDCWLTKAHSAQAVYQRVLTAVRALQ